MVETVAGGGNCLLRNLTLLLEDDESERMALWKEPWGTCSLSKLESDL
jgi:hypothetical protein